MAAILCRTEYVNERFCPKYLFVYVHSCMAHRILCKNRTKQKMCLYTDARHDSDDTMSSTQITRTSIICSKNC